MTLRRIAFPSLLLGLVSLASCAQPNSQSRGFARLNVIAWDETDVKLSALGYSETGESEHDSIELGGGISHWDSGGFKQSSLEVLLGVSEFYEVDAIELSGGGRFYFGQNEIVRPYGAMHGVLTMLDDDLGSQLGIRAGVGSELAVGSSVFLDMNLNYLLPVIPAEDDVTGLLESEIDGMSLRVGVGIDF